MDKRILKKLYSKSLLSVTLFGLVGPVFATTILDIYQQALRCDPVYLRAYAQQLAVQEQLPQATALLYPVIGVTANTAWNNTNTLRQPVGTPGIFLGLTNYNTNGYTVTVTQPLLNLTNWFLRSRASAIAKQANANFIAAGQDLIIRVARSYFDVLQAEDTLRNSRAERDAYASQLYQAKERYRQGVDSLTTVYNSEAAYDASVTQVISNEARVRTTMEALRQLTGKTYCSINGLKREPALIELKPTDPCWWMGAAATSNWDLMAARYAATAAKEQIKANFSGHAPTVNLTASYAPSYGQSVGTVDNVTSSFGLQVSMPLFQGGLVSSQTRQAQDEYSAALEDIENQYRQATITAKQKVIEIKADIEKLVADRQAMVSAGLSVSTTKEAFKVGARSIIDVLLAQQTYYQAEQRYDIDRYVYLLDILLLKQAIGSLTIQDLCVINQYLV